MFWSLYLTPYSLLSPPQYFAPVPCQTQIMAYYLLTVLEQDNGVEVQRLVKDLIRSRVSQWIDLVWISGSGVR